MPGSRVETQEGVGSRRLSTRTIPVPEGLSISSFVDWDPKDYLKTFYSEVQGDELETIKFEEQTKRRSRRAYPFIEDRLTVAEIGCGPTIHHIAPVADIASEIHMYDYVPGNLAAVDEWLKNDPRAHDWTPFIEYTLKCEGKTNPTDSDIKQREYEIRSKVSLLQQLDLGDPHSLAKMPRPNYDFVISAYCADSATDDHDVWHNYMKAIGGTVASKGTLWLAALENAQYYTVGDKIFPSANINEPILRGTLVSLGFYPRSIEIKTRRLPEHRAQGYTGILLATAVKK